MKRLLLVLECSVVLLLCAAGIGLAHVWKQQPITPQVAGICLIVPLVSTLLFLCLSLGIPELYSVNALRFPLNLTLPCVYVGLVVLTMTLISRVGVGIARMPDAFNSLAVWADWRVIGTCLLAGVLCLSALSALGRERQSDENTPPSEMSS